MISSFLFLPESMVRHCFASKDLDRIARQGRLIRTGAESEGELDAAWRKHAAGVDVMITGWDSPCPGDERLALAPHLRLLVHAAGSVKGVVSPAVWGRSIKVAGANHALARGVAETTLGLIITGLKGVFPTGALTRRGGWKDGALKLSTFPVRELFDVTVGVIGAGAIGRQLIGLLKPFEVEILVADPFLEAAQARELGVRLVSLEELMAGSEVVSLHAPSLPGNRHMLGRREFGLMKEHAIFINTARGMLVDEEALAEVLKMGRIWAFLDVTDPEPPRLDHPFRKLENVVLTPHIAGALANGCRRLGRAAADNVEAFARREPLLSEVREEELGRMA